MAYRNVFKISLLSLTLGLFSSTINAAGFQLNEHSAAGLGRAFAGEGAMNDTAAAASRNPATMMMFDRPTVSFGATYVNPTVDIEGKSKHLDFDASENNIAPNEIVPNAHYVHPLSDKFAVGLSLTSNFGLSTQYPDSYVAGTLGGKTEMITGNLNLNGAYRLNEHFSFGLGVNAVYAKAKVIRKAGDLYDYANDYKAGLADSLDLTRASEVANLKGDDWGYGWNIGLLYELDENNRFGLSYRSRVKIKFNGDFKNDLPEELTGVIPGIVPTDGETWSGRLNLTLPDIWEFSAWHKVAPKWAVHYGIMYTQWRTFEELHATGGDNNEELFYKYEGFNDNIRIALGTTYDYSKDLTLRAGIAFDDSAAPNKSRSISIPDQDRLWLTAGANYKFTPNTSVDLGVAYMQGFKVNFTEPAGKNSQPLPGGKEVAYDFTAKGHALLYSMNFNYTF